MDEAAEKSVSRSADAVDSYLRVCRLAVAVAIIKLRPAEGVRKFTASLAERLRLRDEGWKSEARALQEDVLHLKQELLITRLLLKKSRGHQEEWSDQPCPEQTRGDSGCETTSSSSQLQAEKVPDLLLLLLPRDGSLRKHMQFLRSLCGLRRHCDFPVLVDGDGEDAVVWESLVQLLDSVVEVFRRAAVHQPEFLQQAAQLVAQTLSAGRPHGPPAGHLSRVEDLMKEMLGLLLNNQRLNVFWDQAVLVDCLLALGGSVHLRTRLLQILMFEIVQLCEQLGHACQQPGADLDWIHYQNSFFLLRLLEELGPDADDITRRDLLRRLEGRVFPLADDFPLFSMYLWRVVGLLRASRSPEECSPLEPSSAFPGEHSSGDLEARTRPTDQSPNGI